MYAIIRPNRSERERERGQNSNELTVLYLQLIGDSRQQQKKREKVRSPTFLIYYLTSTT